MILGYKSSPSAEHPQAPLPILYIADSIAAILHFPKMQHEI